MWRATALVLASVTALAGSQTGGFAGAHQPEPDPATDAAAIREAAAINAVGVQAAGAGGTATTQSAQQIAQLIEQQQNAQQQTLNQNGLLLSGEGEFLLRQRMRSLRSRCS